MHTLISFNLVQLKATNKVLHLDLKELMTSEGLSRSLRVYQCLSRSIWVSQGLLGTLFQIYGAEDLNAASPCLVLTLGPGSRPVPDHLRGQDGSYQQITNVFRTWTLQGFMNQQQDFKVHSLRDRKPEQRPQTWREVIHFMVLVRTQAAAFWLTFYRDLWTHRYSSRVYTEDKERTRFSKSCRDIHLNP